VNIDPGKALSFPINLRDYCVLPPGQYVASFIYDTSSLPSWFGMRDDAWYGATNMV
jgi:hypothetical protein